MGWVVAWFAVLLIPAITITTCTMGSEDAWVASFVIYTPFSLLVLAAIAVTRRHHSRWAVLSLPLFLILPVALFYVLRFLIHTTIQGEHLCTALTGESGFDACPASWWAPYWAPVQLFVVSAYAFLMFLCWRERLRGSSAS